jgi:hypothetical protein
MVRPDYQLPVPFESISRIAPYLQTHRESGQLQILQDKSASETVSVLVSEVWVSVSAAN